MQNNLCVFSFLKVDATGKYLRKAVNHLSYSLIQIVTSLSSLFFATLYLTIVSLPAKITIN